MPEAVNSKTFCKHIMLVFLMVILSHISDAQKINPQPYFHQFTVDEGLPSNEIYHVIQDSVGYIWIATANGVSQFDGDKFRNWGVDDGILETNIHELYVDYQGRIWFVSSTGPLAYYHKGSVTTYPYNNKIKENISSSRGTLKKSFFVDSADNVHLSQKLYGRVQISPEGIFKRLDGIYQEGSVVMERISNGQVLTSNPQNSQNFDFYLIENEKITHIESGGLFPQTNVHFHYFFVPASDGSYIMAAWGQLYRIKNGKIIDRQRVSSEIIWVGFDRDNKLWVAPIDGGIYCYKDYDFSREPILYLFPESKITSVEQDHESGYWFTTLTNGLFYCPDINVLGITESDGLISNRVNVVFANREGVFLGHELGVVTLFSRGLISTYTITDKESVGAPIRFLGIDSTSNFIMIGSSNFIHKLKDGEIITYALKYWGQGGSYPRQIIKAQEGGYWVASSWGINKFDGDEFTFSSRVENTFSATVFSLCQDDDGSLLLSSVNGIWKYYDGNFTYLGSENHYLAHSSNFIERSNDGKILIGTKGVGLIVKDGNNFRHITQSDGLAGNAVKKIVVDKTGIWLATNQGISWIKDLTADHLDIQNINKSYGLPTNDINDIFIRGNDLYLATNKGLSFFKIDQITANSVKPNCSITNVRVNNAIVDFSQNQLHLSYYQNLIAIDFIGLAFKNLGKVDYRYRMVGVDSLWVYTKNNNAIFSQIPPGKYTFEVQAKNSDGFWSNSASLNIKIFYPYWKTYWFIVLATFLFSGAIFLVYRNRINALKHRNELINSANVYKQQSLRQQMNPHFIFNTLNSIQLYILEKDPISSHKYLTKFARLMRITLDNSQQSAIPLRNELEALKLYLELESLRLEGKFTYSIEVDDNTILDKMVPTLLIQPFVENAIWHGIMLKDDQSGFVRISLKIDNGFIVCTIEDNGVGREKAQSIKKAKSAEHQSLGYKITSQRIELLNTMFKEKFNITYFDLTDQQGEPAGTKVQINIPYSIESE